MNLKDKIAALEALATKAQQFDDATNRKAANKSIWDAIRLLASALGEQPHRSPTDAHQPPEQAKPPA